ncbi:GrpB family protein [Niabella aurantiaca]|uniref:GrpB family protein n=1 Tax=Niabella aurantiaca TaxID=379900 RepID=UPI001B7FB470|nr:GrpB family protein [Niabella aurantiaca]
MIHKNDMKVTIEPYNPEWSKQFEAFKKELLPLLKPAGPVIEHIGSTSVTGLAAKPIIDILAGIKTEKDLDWIPQPMMRAGYIYYEKYNMEMPYRRFFVKLSVSPQSLSLPLHIRKEDLIPPALTAPTYRQAHIHVLPLSSKHWTRHIAFRDYLRAHLQVKTDYQRLKEKLSTREWEDGNAYNKAKGAFLKTEESKAVNWYHSRSTPAF